MRQKQCTKISVMSIKIHVGNPSNSSLTDLVNNVRILTVPFTAGDI